MKRIPITSWPADSPEVKAALEKPEWFHYWPKIGERCWRQCLSANQTADWLPWTMDEGCTCVRCNDDLAKMLGGLPIWHKDRA